MLRCTRVTGRAFEPNYWSLEPERQGPRRPVDEARQASWASPVYPPRKEAVYDVLCGLPAGFRVIPEYDAPADDLIVVCCDRCLSAVVQDVTARSEQPVVVEVLR